MKIITQDQNQIVLKDGNIAGLIIGAATVIAGGYFFYHEYSFSGFSNTIWIAAAIIAVGLIMIFLNSTITVVLDKAQSQITFSTRRLVGGRAKVYNIRDVARVELREAYHMQAGATGPNGARSMPREVLNYQSVIILKDGTQLPLEHQKSSGGTSVGGIGIMGGTGKELSMSNQVAGFLGVPFQEIGPGSAPGVMGAPPINL